MDQYKAGGKGSDRQFWLSAWSSDPITVDRKGAPEALMVSEPFVGISGGIQPEVLKDLSRGPEDRMLDRFLCAYPEPVAPGWRDAHITEAAELRYANLYKQLRMRHLDSDEFGDPLPHKLVFSPSAKAVLVDVINEHAREMCRPGFPASLKGVSVTIDSTSPATINGTGSSTITWHANENGTFSVRVGGTDCSTGTQVASGDYTTQPNTTTATVNAADLADGSNTVRVCVTDGVVPSPNTGSATTTITYNPVQSTSVSDITASTSTYGGTTNLSAKVSPSGAPGSVAFYVNNSSTPASGTVTYNSSTGVATLSNYAHGLNASNTAYSVKAVFTSSSANYTNSNATNVSALTITKAPLTVKADNASREYGEPNPTFNPSYSGFKNSETLATSGVTGSPSFTTTAMTTSPIGDYPITPAVGTLSSGNYSFNYQNGTLKIQFAPATGTCLGSPGHTILQPINKASETDSTFKQGSTVPAKFRVCDANGNSIGTPGVVTYFKLVKTINGTESTTVNEEVLSTTPDNEFRWSSTDQQWIFNINTKKLAAGKTYVYQITLSDKTTIDFQFGLK